MGIDPWSDVRGYLCPVCNCPFVYGSYHITSVNEQTGVKTYYHSSCYQVARPDKIAALPEDLIPKKKGRSFTAPKGGSNG